MSSNPGDFDSSVQDWREKRPDADWLARVIALGMSSGQTVLDAGCGTGTYAQALGAAGLTVVGVDSDTGALEMARKNCVGKCQFAEGDITSLSEDFGRFDWVLLRYVLHNLPLAIRSHVVLRMKGLISAGGRLVVETSPRDAVLAHFDCQLFPPLAKVSAEIYPSTKDIVDLLTSVGFAVYHQADSSRKLGHVRNLNDVLEDSLRLVRDGRGPFAWRQLPQIQREQFHSRRVEVLPRMFPSGQVPREWPSQLIVAR